MACLFKGISIQVQYSIDGCLKPGEAFFQPRTNDGRRVCLQGLQGLRQGPLLGSHVRFPRSQRVDQLPLVHDDVGIFRPPTMECGWDTWLLKWMRDWPANLLIEHQHHVAAMSLNMSNSCAVQLRSASPNHTLTPDGRGKAAICSQHTAFNYHRWVCISSCWRHCAHKHRFPALRSGCVFLVCVVWRRRNAGAGAPFHTSSLTDERHDTMAEGITVVPVVTNYKGC